MTTPHGSLIVLDRSIGGASLGESRVAVERDLGHGRVLSASVDRSARPKPEHVTTVSYRGGTLTITYAENRAGLLETTSPRYRTRSGVGVGSQSAAMQALGGVKCYAAGVECQHGFAAVNRPGTAFRLDRPGGRVVAVVITTGH